MIQRPYHVDPPSAAYPGSELQIQTLLLSRAGNPAFRTRDGRRVRPGQKRKDPVPQGHVMPPGGGPAGETCGSCQHLYRNVQAKVYLKCGLNEQRWTGGRPRLSVRERSRMNRPIFHFLSWLRERRAYMRLDIRWRAGA